MELLTYVDIFLVACGMWNWICRMRDITLRDIAIPNPKSILRSACLLSSRN